jgi:alpha-1,2-glucosyltransferase
VVAAIWHPLLLVTRLWPYIALLVSFAGFVVWNGGVVLGTTSLSFLTTLLTHSGDKSNHVATIHLPQMLYIWPLITFFSVPLIVPVGVSFLQDLLSLLRLPLFPRLVWSYLLVVASAFVALAATILIIKYNTIIHPFTLADNRHYMFYVFRYTILRHPLVRYLLAPAYIACAYLVYLTLCGPSKTPEPKLTLEKRAEELSRPIPTRNVARPKQEGPKLSFILILLATTALSLITAPLVEPRYFIIPWVIWRLNVPPLNPDPRSVLGVSPGAPTMRQDLGFAARLWDDLKTHDYRLWLETAWFLLINVITGYVFLYRGFEWKQEPGKIQRFMW